MDSTDEVFLGLFLASLAITFFIKVRPWWLFAVSFAFLIASGMLVVLSENQWADLTAVAGFLGLIVSIIAYVRINFRTFQDWDQ